MKRMMIIAAVAAMLFEPLSAAAQGYGRGGRWGDGDHGGGRGGGRYQARGPERQERQDRYEGRGGRWDPGGAPGRQRYEPRPDVRRREDPRNMPPIYGAPRAEGRSWRQGQYLPPAYRGGVLRDPGRFRLRRPPAGYDWVGVGPDIYLMQRSTGMVLDTIPGGR